MHKAADTSAPDRKIANLVRKIQQLQLQLEEETQRNFPNDDIVIDGTIFEERLKTWRKVMGPLIRVPSQSASRSDDPDVDCTDFDVPFGPEWELKQAEAELFTLLKSK